MRLYCAPCHGGMETDHTCGWCTGDGWFTVADLLRDLAADVGTAVRTARIRAFGWNKAERAQAAQLTKGLAESGIRILTDRQWREERAADRQFDEDEQLVEQARQLGRLQGQAEAFDQCARLAGVSHTDRGVTRVGQWAAAKADRARHGIQELPVPGWQPTDVED